MRRLWKYVLIVMLVFTTFGERTVGIHQVLGSSRSPERVSSPTGLPGTEDSSSSLPPLPRSCISGGTGMTTTGSNPLCCISGYVYADGKPVADAKVTITSAKGELQKWTGEGPDSTEPYYHASLSGAPLDVQVGETITITVRYGSFTETITHTVVSAGQQVDITTMPEKPGDFVFDRQLFQTPEETNPNIYQLYQQAPIGRFNFYKPDIAVDATDTVYVSDWVNGRIQVFNNKGQFVRQWGTQGDRSQQFMGPSSIAVDTRGNVYVAEMGSHRVQKFSTNGTFVTSWGSFGTEPGQFQFPAGIAVDTAGNVYVADTGNHRVQRFNSNGGSPHTWTTSGTPYSIAVAGSDTIYIADAGTNRVHWFKETETITEARTLDTTFRFKNENALDAGVFAVSAGLSVDVDGNVYVADSGNNRVMRFNVDGSLVRTWQPNGTTAFNQPAGIDVDSQGTVYVADTYHHIVRSFHRDTPSTTQTSGTIENSKVVGSLGIMDNRLNNPTGIVVSPDTGHVFVADTATNRVIRFDAQGRFVNQWSEANPADPQSRFNRPTGLAIVNERLLIADTGSNRVLQLPISSTQPLASTTLINGTWLGAGIQPLLFRQPGQAGENTHQFTGGLAITPNGDLYVANTYSKRVTQFTTSGDYVREWGVEGIEATQPFTPTGVTVMGNGTVLIADIGSNRIRSFLPGRTTTITTWLASKFSDTTEPFSEPTGIAVDDDDNVYVTDSEGTRVLKFNKNKDLVEIIGGTTGSGPGDMIEPQGVAIGDTNGQRTLYVADHDLNRVQVFRPMTYSLPVATIVAASAHEVAQGSTVTIRAMGSSSDGAADIESFHWSVPAASPVKTQPTFLNQNRKVAASLLELPTQNLSPGTYTVTLNIKDVNGRYSEPQSTTIVVTSPKAEKTWTFMLYLAGDNADIAPYFSAQSPLGALNRLLKQTSSNVNVVALYDGDTAGDTTLYAINGNKTISETRPMGELNMGDPQTLIEFVRKAKELAPAEHYYLAIADHANGLDGIAWDKNISEYERLTNAEVRHALIDITGNGAHPIDVLHFDGCLMGQLENAYQMRAVATYLVASQNLGWSAFAYDAYRAAVTSNTTPRALATTIVDQYSAQVSVYPHTIAAYDLSKLRHVVGLTNTLAEQLQKFVLANSDNGKLVNAWRTGTSTRRGVQKFDSNQNYRITKEDVFVDLYDWAETVRNNSQDTVIQAASSAVMTALKPSPDNFIVRERSATGRFAGNEMRMDDAHGISVYFPPRLAKKTFTSYVQGDLQAFSEATAWDEFLSAALAGETFDSSEPVAVDNEPLSVTPPTLTSIAPTSITLGHPTMPITVTGTNFLQTSIVEWDAVSKFTQYISSTQLVAFVPASDLARAGVAEVTVYTPGPGGGRSASQIFTIELPQPRISTFSPAAAIVGSPTFTLTIVGEHFTPASTVKVNSSERTTTFMDSKRLQMTIGAAEVARLGVARVDVYTPGTKTATASFRTVPTSWSNHVRNPGFDDLANKQASVPTEWATQGARRVERPKRNGTASLLFPATNGQIATATQALSTIKPFVPYTVSSWVYIPDTTGTVSGTMRVEWRDAKGALLKPVPSVSFTKQLTSWTRISNDMIAPKDAVSARVTFAIQSTKPAVYVDDVSLIPASILSNGDFEVPSVSSGSIAGWTGDPHVQRITGRAVTGSYMLQHIANNDASYTFSHDLPNISSGMPYDVSCFVRVPKVGQSSFAPSTPDQFLFQIEVEWRNAQRQPIGTSPLTTTMQVSTIWREAKATVLAPAGTTSGSLRMVVASLNATIQVDKCAMRIGSLVVDGGFEGSGPFTPSIGTWTTNTSVSRSSVARRTGKYGMALKVPNSSAYTIRNQLMQPVIAGTSYKTTTFVMIPLSTDPFKYRIIVDWLDKDGAVKSTLLLREYAKSTDGWKAVTAYLTAPEGATKAQLRMEVSGLNTDPAKLPTNVIYVDDVEFRP